MIENGRKWLKGGWFANGSDFEKDMKPDHWKSGQMGFFKQNPFEIQKKYLDLEKSSFQMVGTWDHSYCFSYNLTL